MSKIYKYHCENGAYHDYSCCETCWNKHPLNYEGKMFTQSEEYSKILKENWINSCLENGFTKQQATFLYNNSTK